MLTRLAIFEGRVKPGQEEAMRAYVETELAPLWRQFQPSKEVRVLYNAEEGDIPLVLAVTYVDRSAMEAALDTPARYQSRDMLPAFYERFFEEVSLKHQLFEADVFAGDQTLA